MAILIPNFKLAKDIGDQVEIQADSIEELIRIGTARYGEDFDKATRSCGIMLNGRSIQYYSGKKTPLKEDDTIWFIVPSGGG